MIRIIAIIISLAALILVLVLLLSRKQKPWNELTEKEKNKKKILIASGITVFMAGLITAILLGRKKN